MTKDINIYIILDTYNMILCKIGSNYSHFILFKSRDQPNQTHLF